MNSRTYGPAQTWPTHQKPYWNKALGEARNAGWTLTYIDAPHSFGSVSCPAGEHTFSVDKTARGGETKAKEAIKKIRWCPDSTAEPGSKVRSRQRECERLLAVAEELITIAEDGLTAAVEKQAAQHELDRIELLLQTANSNLSEILAEQEAALLAALEVDYAPKPAGISATLEDAREKVQHGESVARTLSAGRPNLAAPLLHRARQAYARIDGLSAPLGTLQERN